MFLHRLSLHNFKNYERKSLKFSEKLNCFTGPNGVGKTNLLDAIYYLCITRSYFNSTDQYNLRQGEPFFRLDGEIERGGNDYEVKCVYQLPRKKDIVVNDDRRKRLSDHVGEFPVVMVAPDDNKLIIGGGEERRRFIDTLLTQVDRAYLEALQSYNKVLTQRNAWLKRMQDKGYVDTTMIATYDEQLTAHAQVIFDKRTEYIQQMTPQFNEAYRAVSGGKEEVELRYVSPLQEKSLGDWLKVRREKDLILGRTTKGIHRDDLEFVMNGMVVKHFGSQGQQKSFLVSLKLAQYRILANAKSIPPFLLLDDIFDKLDPQRCGNLLTYLNDHEFGQIFISDTQRSRIETIFEHNDKKPEMFEIG